MYKIDIFFNDRGRWEASFVDASGQVASATAKKPNKAIKRILSVIKSEKYTFKRSGCEVKDEPVCKSTSITVESAVKNSITSTVGEVAETEEAEPEAVKTTKKKSKKKFRSVKDISPVEAEPKVKINKSGTAAKKKKSKSGDKKKRTTKAE